MDHKCTVPTGMKTTEDGSVYYVKCGLDAEYKVGGWYMCEGHKKYLADIEKWPAEPINELERGD